MGWVQTNWKSVDSSLNGLPYSTQITYTPVEDIDTTGIAFCWDLSQEYVVFRGTPIVDSINTTNIKFWTHKNFETLGLPVSAEVKSHVKIPGACRDCSNLTSVSIPQSVKYIDYYAFWGTGLTEVTIAQDCVYQNSSFPAGCTINYYT